VRTVAEAMWHGLETRLAEVKARLEHGYCDITETIVGRVEMPVFSRSTFWAVCCCQFETLAEDSKWALCTKAMYLLAALQGWASNHLQGVCKGVTYEETIRALEDCFGGPTRGTIPHSA
jgi:hypothetical protein